MSSSPSGDGKPAAAGMDLFVVLPVYNEATILEGVVEEWLPALTAATTALSVCILDDGSTDGTAAVAQRLAQRHDCVEVVHRANAGHGQTCVYGYRLASERGARFVFQIDSDGQCDPAAFSRLWARRDETGLVFGYRRVRLDGRVREAVSRLTTVGVWLATGIWTRDPNVPYRLMRTEVLHDAAAATPANVDLANVYVTAALMARADVRWVDITFRERAAGRSHHNLSTGARRGWAVLHQLARDRRQLREPVVDLTGPDRAQSHASGSGRPRRRKSLIVPKVSTSSADGSPSVQDSASVPKRVGSATRR